MAKRGLAGGFCDIYGCLYCLSVVASVACCLSNVQHAARSAIQTATKSRRRYCRSAEAACNRALRRFASHIARLTNAYLIVYMLNFFGIKCTAKLPLTGEIALLP